MTDRYYDAGGSGSNTSPYDTAAKAATTLAAALGVAADGDEKIYVLSTSDEAISTIVWVSPYASFKSKQRVYSVSSLSTPTTLTYGAKMHQNASTDDIALGGTFEIYGVHFDLGTGTSTGTMTLGTASTYNDISLIDCKVTLNTGASSTIQLGIAINSATTRQYQTYSKNLTLYTKGTQTPITIFQGYHIIDNLILTGSAAPTTLLKGVSPSESIFILSNSDLSGLSWTNLIDVSITYLQSIVTITNCKLPASVNITTGTFTTSTSTVTLINTSSGDINYQYAKYCLAGSIITIDSIYATTSPIQIGGVSVSDIFTTSSSAGRTCTLSRSYLVEVADNSTVTPFVELLVQTSGASALNNDQVYITAETVTVAGTTQGTLVTSHPGLLATPAACSGGTTAYTGDSYATERTHRIETASITTRQAGLVKITVHLAVASTAIYVGRVGVV